MSNAKDLANLATGKVPKKSPQSETEATEQVVSQPIGLDNPLDNFGDFLPEAAQPFWQLIQQYPLLEGLAVILIFAALAFFIRSFAIRLIQRLTSKTATNKDDKIIGEIRGPVFYTVIWIGTIFAVATLDYEFVWLRYITPIILSIILLLWARTGLRLCNIIFSTLSNTTAHSAVSDEPAQPLFNLISKILVLLVSCYCLLLIWGINPIGLLASAGIVGIAVGFAAKDTLANLFSGVFILADRPYEVGDYVNLDGGERGMVTHIGIRSTRIITRDDIEITIPNGVIGNAKVINESGGPDPKIRIRINFQCGYDADVEDICVFLTAVAQDNPLICKHPTPSVRIKGFAESGINLQLRGWIIQPEQRGRAIHDLSVEILRAFNERNIKMPYPKRDITISENTP